MTVITVSREYGSRGEEVGRQVAQALGYSYFDKNILANVARLANTNEDEIRKYDETDQQRLRKFLKKLFLTQPVVAAEFPYFYPPTIPVDWSIEPFQKEATVDPKSVTALFLQMVEELYSRDRVVIVGRGSQKILAAKPSTLHIRFVGTIENRIQVVMAADDLTLVQAEQKIASIDKGRATYLRRHYNADWNDVTLYHLCVNTSLMTVEHAVSSIVAAVHQRQNQTDHPQSDENL